MKLTATARAIIVIAVLTALPAQALRAQTRPDVGVRDNPPTAHALVGARIIVAPGRVLEKGTLVIRDGTIAAVGADLTPPADARVHDMTGLTLHAGWIEPYATLDLADAPAAGKAGHWNASVRPDVRVSDLYQPKTKSLDSLRRLGFTAALVVPREGIVRGQSALVSVRDGDTNAVTIADRLTQHASLGRARNGYPRSLMGTIALHRQLAIDAQWYRRAHAAYAKRPAGQERPEVNNALRAYEAAAHGEQPIVFAVRDVQHLLRAAAIAREFGLRAFVRGGGDAYQMLDAVKQANLPLVLPLDFPRDIEVDSAEAALAATLTELVHWDQAPSNPAYLHAAGVRFVLTSDGLEKRSDFPARLRLAIARGLSADAALAALTTGPAALLGVSDRLGTLEVGKLAHVVVRDAAPFEKKSAIREVWVDGERQFVERPPIVDVTGTWTAQFSGATTTAGTLSLSRKGERLRGSLTRPAPDDQTKPKKHALQRVKQAGARLHVLVKGDAIGREGRVRLSGRCSGSGIAGTGIDGAGNTFAWSATRADTKPAPTPAPTEGPTDKPTDQPGDEPAKGDGDAEKEDKPRAAVVKREELVFPLGANGRRDAPANPGDVVVTGVTLWTCGPAGTIEGGAMHVKDGKIVAVGKDFPVPAGAHVIKGEGLHVTPGLIDCHSHTAMSGGWNESGQAVSSEVRVGDILNATDINIYRELAGGLTAMNILHGSANPIGGQNQVVKLRWGSPPDVLKLAAAPPGIKFALGENVTRANSRSPQTRYPATRMGVEQLMHDRFQAAIQYERARNAYDAAPKDDVVPPRRDLELEALLEIVRGKRLIHCHSYRQDEILMLVRLADRIGFRIGTFQHVLEGYKVADAIAKHGAGGSSFSDWWAYKMEVYNAIPHNGALMHAAGVNVSFNSDSNELARRMNTEAAKAVKYGGLSEVEALRFVTINPANQLGVGDRVGSLEQGKDADFAVWSGHPLSTYTRCLETWIDGRKYFDRAEDLARRAKDAALRERIIQQLLVTGNGKARSAFEKPEAALNHDHHGRCRCDELHVHDEDEEHTERTEHAKHEEAHADRKEVKR